MGVHGQKMSPDCSLPCWPPPSVRVIAFPEAEHLEETEAQSGSTAEARVLILGPRSPTLYRNTSETSQVSTVPVFHF